VQPDDDLTARFLQILHRHRGARNAIQVRELAGRLGLGEGHNGQRIVQIIKRELVENGTLIGSSCGKQPGYFIPDTADEMKATLQNYEARLRSLVALIRATKGAAEFKTFMGQLAMEFEEEVPVT
jgi:hypothetical protein